MRISSFDIFDTCLVRKCGTPDNFFDMLSLRAFNGDVPEWARQEFVAARRKAASDTYSISTTIDDIWNTFAWTHPQLKSKTELCQLEQDMEREMLVPVLTMLDKVHKCRKRGDKIIFISDMYLSSAFLTAVMREKGFYKDGDSLYVSCECDAAKYDGGLFRYVKQHENISVLKWHHYGDNKCGDYKAPLKLGIKATLIKHHYTPYQQKWIGADYSLGFKYASILAGIGRALHYSTEWTTHTDFVLDIIAPFYCSLVYRMMHDAEQRGIQRLYFLARDAYMMFLIAEKYKPFFPSIECKFLYISRTSLYEGNEEAKQAYFSQEGLITKTDNIGIVDIRSSGQTLRFLNDWLAAKGAKQVRGYYFELSAFGDMQYFSQDYYVEVNGYYIKSAKKLGRLLDYWNIYEQFFPLNTLHRTIDYAIGADGIAYPIFDTEDESKSIRLDCCEVKNLTYWAEVHKRIIMQYVEAYLPIARYSDKIFEECVMSCIGSFFDTPHSYYLLPLTDFYAYYSKGEVAVILPYVKKCNMLELLRFNKERKAIWKRGSLIYSIPNWLYAIVDKIIH